MSAILEKLADLICSSAKKNKILFTTPKNMSNLMMTVKEGYAYKRGAINTDWKKRLFVLNKQQLLYFKGGKANPSGNIQISVIQHITEVQKDNIFKVYTPGRVYELRTDTQEDALGWVEALTQLANQPNGDVAK